ncbi:MAG: hypothetical protein D6705_09195 [Deltaproteobacteria bacterium]|nr:MAG: hypothetical protein D6705_09195 [Deltaproteobacteria bacterium]
MIRGLALGTALAGCSTVAPPAMPVACASDEDCDTDAGEVCAIDQGRCVPGSDVPPLADLAFDVREPGMAAGEEYAFRSEILGCDAAVELVSTDDRQITVRRGEILQRWSFIVEKSPPFSPEDLPLATVEVRGPSRIGLRDLTRQVGLEDTEEGTRTPFVDWPYRHPTDTATLGPFGTERAYLRVVPGPDLPAYERWIAPAAARTDLACTSDEDCCPMPPCSQRVGPVCLSLGDAQEQACSHVPGTNWLYDASPLAACIRSLGGEVRRFDGVAPASPVEGATVSIRYAPLPDAPKPLALAPLGPPPPEQVCTSDADCIEGLEVCVIEEGALAGRCSAPLAGRPATKGSVVTDVAGAFDTVVYTHCDDAPTAQHDRAFDLTVVPPPEIPAPAVDVRVTTTFLAAGGGVNPGSTIATPLCIPDWMPAVDVVVRTSGEPVVLATDAMGQDVACCETGCLSAFGNDEGDTTLPTPTTCHPVTTSGSARVVATAPFEAPPTSAWEDLGCAPLARNAGTAGEYRREGTCDAEGACTLSALPGGGDLDQLTVRIESPVGSVLGSTMLSLPVPPPTDPMEVTLPRRALVRGKVRLGGDLCDAEKPGDCSDVQATVIAERLRMPGESEATVPGPYLHTVPTYVDPATGEPGTYVLPLDPGVWLVTALPQAGSRGDPAPIEILDLRDGEDLSHDIVLPLGIRVTLELRGFDPRAQVSPWDIGSWKNLDHPGRDGPVRLSDPGECLSTLPGLACQIRALTPRGSALLPSITGTVQVTARKPSHVATCG